MADTSGGVINGMIKRAMEEVMRKEAEKEPQEKIQEAEVSVKEKLDIKPKEEEKEEEKIENVQKFYEEGVKTISDGLIIDGDVVQIDNEGVLVSVGAKTEGFIPLEELSIRRFSTPTEVVSVGDKIKVYVLTAENEEGNLILSKKRVDLENAWNKILTAFDQKEFILAKAIKQVKGGLLVDIEGINGFIPASEVSQFREKGLDRYLRKMLKLKILECDRNEKRIILSHKSVIEEEEKAKKQILLDSLHIGKICSGKVVRITDFGVFVDLGGIDGLIHVSELAYRRIKHPKEIVRNIGDSIEVIVLAIDKEKERVSLSLKQTKVDPWQEVSKKFAIGSIVTGKVSKIGKSYIFVHLEDGIEGLVPLSELSVKKVSAPSEVVKDGEQVQVKILDINPLERKMSLSLKRVYQDEEKQKTQTYLVAQKNGMGATLGDVFKEKFGEKSELMKKSLKGKKERSE
ncbi:MAG: 30S ribosomal protein S1 [bacterium]|nr:30S ribosomal protein S1 [bacterium]